MKRFYFPLRPVTILRAHEQQRAREALARAVQDGQAAEAALAAVRARKSEFEAAMAAGRAGRFSAREEASGFAAYQHECLAEEKAEQALDAARKTVDERRQACVVAHQRLEVVEKLEENARRAHRAANARAEQAEYDDFAGRTHAARARQEIAS